MNIWHTLVVNHITVVKVYTGLFRIARLFLVIGQQFIHHFVLVVLIWTSWWVMYFQGHRPYDAILFVLFNLLIAILPYFTHLVGLSIKVRLFLLCLRFTFGMAPSSIFLEIHHEIILSFISIINYIGQIVLARKCLSKFKKEFQPSNCHHNLIFFIINPQII